MACVTLARKVYISLLNMKSSFSLELLQFGCERVEVSLCSHGAQAGPEWSEGDCEVSNGSNCPGIRKIEFMEIVS